MKSSIKILSILLASLTILWMTAGKSYAQQTPGQLFEKALYAEEVEGDLAEAIELYQQVLEENPDNRQLAARAILHKGLCYEKLGSEQARLSYYDVLSKYSEQAEEAAIARERITHLDAYVAELNTKAEQHMKKGNELFKSWAYESAIKEYEDAITLRPNTLLAMNAQYSIGHSLYKAGNYEDAMATLTNLMEENPESNITPVTELMLYQVQYAMENTNNPSTAETNYGEDTLVDPKSGITFRKIKSLTGESDIITWPTFINLSPNGKFLLLGNTVVPLDGTNPFGLIDFQATGVQATRGTWSPDGTKAAFYSGDAICVVPVSPETGHTTGPFKKIHKGEHLKWIFNPGWSPDSKKLVYGDPGGDIWTINADGTDLKQITKTETKESVPSWSPDGKNIVYRIRERKSIGIYSLDNGNSIELSYGDGIQGNPVWAPDGKLLIVDWKKIYCYDLTDKSKTEFDFSPPKEAGTFFSWSKDMRKMLFFHSSYFANMGLKIASPDGGPSFEPVPLLTNWGTARWSGDSKLIAVQGEDENDEIAIRILPLSGEETSVINLDNLVEGKPFPFKFSFNPGKLIFSIERGDGKEDIYAVAVFAEKARTTGPAVKIFDGWYREGAYNTKISLSRDGEKVALIHEGDIWIAYTNGDNPKKTTERGGYLRWTDNGKVLILKPTGWSLLENPGPQGRMIELLDDGKKIECRWPNIDISPDNSRFAVLSYNQIKINPVEGSKSSQVLDISGLGLKQCYSLEWSPDGKNLTFVGMKETDDPDSFPDGRYYVYKISIDGGKPVRVAPDDDYTKYAPSWSPDGNWIAYSVDKSVKIRPASTIWAVDFEEIIEYFSE